MVDQVGVQRVVAGHQHRQGVLRPASGGFRVGPGVRIAFDPALRAAAEGLAGHIEAATGQLLPLSEGPGGTGAITLALVARQHSRERRNVLALMNGYLEASAVRNDIADYITLPGLGLRAGVLGAMALAETA